MQARPGNVNVTLQYVNYLFFCHSYELDADLPHILLSYSRQIASGMNYVAAKAFVHRDLVARNILISEQDICKVCKLG